MKTNEMSAGKNNVGKNDPRALLMLTASMLIFGTVGVFRRLIPMDSALIAFFRGAAGCLVILLFSRLRGGKRERPGRKTLLLLALSGAVIGLNWLALFEAFNAASVATATLCYYMEPTFVILLSCALFREKLTLKKAACAVVALGGMALVSGVAENGMPGPGERKGILLGLCAAGLYSAVVLMNKSIRGVDPYIKTEIQLAAAAAVLLPYLLAAGGFSGQPWSWGTVGLLLLMGVVHTGLSYALYFGSMDGLRTQTVALFSYIDPVTALVLSALVLHEKMTVPGMIGAVMVLGSAIVGERE